MFNLFNAEMSPKKYWRGPRSQEMEGGGWGGGGDYSYSYTVTTGMTSALRVAVTRATSVFH